MGIDKERLKKAPERLMVLVKKYPVVTAVVVLIGFALGVLISLVF